MNYESEYVGLSYGDVFVPTVDNYHNEEEIDNTYNPLNYSFISFNYFTDER